MTETSNSPMTARVRAFLDRPHRLLIGGEWVDAASGKTFETRDPATGEVLATVAHAEQADIDAAVAAALESRTRVLEDLSRLSAEIARGIDRNDERVRDRFEELTRALTELLPLDVAKELTLTARRIEGTEAARIGLATRVSEDPVAAAIEIDPDTGVKSFNTRAAKATERIAGKGYSVVLDETLTALPEPRYPADPAVLSQVTAAGFNQRRKMLRASLKGLHPAIEDLLVEAGIAPTARAEEIGLEGFCTLARNLAQARGKT